MKRLCIGIFALVLATAAFAQTEADFTVTLTSDGTGAVIKGYTGKTAQVRIPETIQGMPVREIEAFSSSGSEFVTSVVIPQGVTKIGIGAFEKQSFDDSKLVSITIPEGVLEIGGSAFAGTALTEITLPQSLTSLGFGAFRGTSITTVTIPSGILSSGEEFARCKNLRSVIISEGIEEISQSMFEDCGALVKVTLPDSIRVIGGQAFLGTAITEIALPSSIEEIGYRSFADCPNLTTVTVSGEVQHINFLEGYGGSFNGSSKINLASQAALRRLGYTGNF